MNYTKKAFQLAIYLLGAFSIIAAAATVSFIPDGAGWDERFLVVTSAIGPWLISVMIVWAAGGIIPAMDTSRDDD